MGVRGLYSFLQSYSRKRTFNQLLSGAKQRIGIDISYYLYKWQGDIHRIISFIESFRTNGHTVIVVFDGKAEEGKQWETKRRQTQRNEEMETAQSIKDAIEENKDNLTQEQQAYLESIVQSHEKRGWHLSREVRHAIKNEMYKNFIPLLKAIGEADPLLTSLSIRKEVDCVISGDMDLFVMGTRVQYFPTQDGLTFNVFNRSNILSAIGLTDSQFRSFCAMCFTEYTSVIQHLDIRKAYHGIRVFRTLENLKKDHLDWLEVWPTENHILFKNLNDIDPLIRSDEKDRYLAFIHNNPMPYYNSKKPDTLIPDSVVG